MQMSSPTRDHREIRAWAQKQGIVPVEVMPERVDHEPGRLSLVPAASLTAEIKDALITWEDFFAKFDLMGLACVYDTGVSGFNQILQTQGKSPYLHHNLSSHEDIH